MQPLKWLIFSATLVLFIGTNLAKVTNPNSKSADKITSLPGQPIVDFEQYAGYVTVDEQQQRRLFYYFVEAESKSHSKPLVIWLNGGPGCSSIGAGAFTENGPFKPRGEVLIKNDYSWNKEANMLYLESPAGVGFSYSANKSYYNSVNDEMTARDNLAFLQNWLVKFPEYKDRDLFIAGESYGGHYVPQLANAILQSSLKSNLKGIALGNPLLEFNTDFNSVGEYFWSHGLISESTYELLQTKCNYSQIRRQSQHGQKQHLTPACFMVNFKIRSEIGLRISYYDVTLDVCRPSVSQQAYVLASMPNDDVQKVDVCQEDETNTYLNRKDVHKSMNAQLVGVDKWYLCRDLRELRYNMDNLEVSTLPLLATLTKAGVRVLVYSGDQDSVLPLIGTRVNVHNLAKELGLNTTVTYRAWLQGEQVGGWTQVYGDILTFATVRGAAHEAPYTQPERSLVLFSSFLKGQPLPGLATQT